MPLCIPYVPLMVVSLIAAVVLGSMSQDIQPRIALFYASTAALFLFVVHRSWIYPFYLSPLRHIPTAPGFPLWGHFWEVITTEVGVPQREWHARYGGIVRYFFPFGSERLSVTDDDALKQITTRNPYNYPKPLRVKLWMMPALGEGVLLAEGHAHAKQRKALSPAFSITSIRALMPIFWTKCLHLSDLWDSELQNEASASKTFEVLEWLNRTTLDIIGRAGLGTDVDSLDNPEDPIREAYRKFFDFSLEARIVNGLAVFTQLVRYLPLRSNREFEWARNRVTARAAKIIKEKQSQALQPGTNMPKDIISLIVQDNKHAMAEDALSVDIMRNQVMTMLGAGHDTTASSVAWTLLLLSKRLLIQQRLREEIRTYMPFLSKTSTRNDPDLLQKADVDTLPYLENVTREALRYIPSIPLTVRQSLNDDQLGRYFIPGGTTIYVMANCINRMESYWGPTANVFDPDRWDSLPETFTPNAFMTFLHGPRGCVGRKFAEIEMKILLCSLLSRFNFACDSSWQDPEELKMWRLVLRPKDGINLKVTRVNA